MKKGWSEVTFTDFSTLVRREAPIDDDGEYPEVGVRCFGKGLFHKLARTGLEVGDKKLFRLKEGDFILQVTFAWEGAVAIVGKEDETFFGSVRVLTFEIDAAICDTRFLLWYFRTATGVAQLARISPGTAGRNKVLSIGRLGEMKIPLPPLAEQQRIVAHLDAIESRLTRVKKLREEIAKEAEAFTTSLHLAAAKGRMVRLGQLMRLDETKESVTAEGSYPQIGIRSFGMGLFKKPSVLGANTTYRAFNVLSCGQFVMSQVKGWEGAVGVAKEDCEGWFASPEYRTFSCIEDECDWKYLAHIASTSWFRKQLLAATKGIGARRERVRPEKLLSLEMPFPVVNRQKEGVSLLEKQVAGKRLSALCSVREAAILPSVLDSIFKS